MENERIGFKFGNNPTPAPARKKSLRFTINLPFLIQRSTRNLISVRQSWHIKFRLPMLFTPLAQSPMTPVARNYKLRTAKSFKASITKPMLLEISGRIVGLKC